MVPRLTGSDLIGHNYKKSYKALTKLNIQNIKTKELVSVLVALCGNAVFPVANGYSLDIPSLINGAVRLSCVHTESPHGVKPL